jgi:hypothetical protein
MPGAQCFDRGFPPPQVNHVMRSGRVLACSRHAMFTCMPESIARIVMSAVQRPPRRCRLLHTTDNPAPRAQLGMFRAVKRYEYVSCPTHIAPRGPISMDPLVASSACANYSVDLGGASTPQTHWYNRNNSPTTAASGALTLKYTYRTHDRASLKTPQDR